KADHARADLIEAQRPLQQGTCKRGVMHIGRREQKEERQAGAATEQGMHAIATQEGSWMVGRGMTNGGIGISSAPSQDGSAIDDQITCPNQTAPQSRQHGEDKECLRQRSPSSLSPFPRLERDWEREADRADQAGVRR